MIKDKFNRSGKEQYRQLDASENTKKKFRNMCTYYEVPLYFLSDKESLGRAMGKEFRASLAVQDENFAKAIMKALEKESGR